MIVGVGGEKNISFENVRYFFCHCKGKAIEDVNESDGVFDENKFLNFDDKFHGFLYIYTGIILSSLGCSGMQNDEVKKFHDLFEKKKSKILSLERVKSEKQILEEEKIYISTVSDSVLRMKKMDYKNKNVVSIPPRDIYIKDDQEVKVNSDDSLVKSKSKSLVCSFPLEKFNELSKEPSKELSKKLSKESNEPFEEESIEQALTSLCNPSPKCKFLFLSNNDQSVSNISDPSNNSWSCFGKNNEYYSERKMQIDKESSTLINKTLKQ